MSIISLPDINDNADATKELFNYRYDTIVDVINGHIDDTNIADGSITNAKLANGSVTASKMNIQSAELFYDFIASGGLINQTTGLTGNFSDVVYYIGGVRYTLTGVANHTYTASKDTYVYLTATGVDYSNEEANNVRTHTAPANSILLTIVITSASALTNVNRGGPFDSLPNIGGNNITVQDSTGNLIYPRDPQRRLIGYRSINSNQATSSDTAVAATGMSCPVIVPTGRKIKAEMYVPGAPYNDTNNGGIGLFVWRTFILTGVQVAYAVNEKITPVSAHSLVAKGVDFPQTGSTSILYLGAIARSGGTGSAQTNNGLRMTIELE